MDRYGQLGSAQTRAYGGRRSYEARKDNPVHLHASLAISQRESMCRDRFVVSRADKFPC